MAVRVLYHLSSPLPPVTGTDAVVQEIDALRGRFGGDLNVLYPFRRPGRHWPRALYGLQRLRALRVEEAKIDLHHVYGPDLYIYPVLRALKRPVVYAVTTSLDSTRARPPRGLQIADAVVVTNARDLATARAWGVRRAVLIRPGIDLSRFTPAPRSSGPGLRLLVGSAPWTARHFHLKGVDALLAAAGQMPTLSLVFLWRGLLLDAMRRRVARLRLEDRVEILSEKVDVNAVLGRVDGAVVLAKAATIVKAFPHSLLESLAAGKPVLLSRVIPMADYVEETGCGVVVGQLTVHHVLAGIRELIARYDALRCRAEAVGRQTFSLETMLSAYGAVYADVSSGQLSHA
jgi:glycosyltransferase involved in cell wall biosynthesis